MLIDPFNAGSFLDICSAMLGVTNEQVLLWYLAISNGSFLVSLFKITWLQFSKKSVINFFKCQEYKDYRKAQRMLEKQPEWNEFLKLNKKQCQNFKVTN